MVDVYEGGDDLSIYDDKKVSALKSETSLKGKSVQEVLKIKANSETKIKMDEE